MRALRPVPIALALIFAALPGCRVASHGPLPPQTTLGPHVSEAQAAISGTVAFELDSRSATKAVSPAGRKIQIAPSELVSLATVTLLDTNGRTIAATRTNATGVFTLLPGPAFSPVAGAIYILDAYKGTASNAVGANVARLRTMLQWTSGGWTSTSGSNVTINPLTTAVCVIQGLQSGSIPATATLGTVTGATVTSANATIAANWSAVNGMVQDLLAKDQDPLARIAFLSGSYAILPGRAANLEIANFRQGTFEDTALDPGGKLILAGPRPAPNDKASELDYFSTGGVAPFMAGNVASDGTYLYIVNWDSYGGSSSLKWTFKRVGTGFGGTIRGKAYGTLGPPVANTLSVAYANGYLYIPIRNDNAHLQQLSTSTGILSTVDVPTPLITRETGLETGPEGFRLITSDGRYLYNLAYAIGGTAYNGFTVQVLDPSQGFRQVRLFTMDNSSYYTDGVFCDGTYLYPIEWSGGGSARARRYRLSDGVREAQWTFPQFGYTGQYEPSENNPINGTWDAVNRVFWIGNLGNDKVHLLRGGSFIPAGRWESPVLDAGSTSPLYGRLTWAGTMPRGASVKFQVRSAASAAGLASATYQGPSGPSDYYTASGTPLNPLHAGARYLQVRALLESADQTGGPVLSRIAVEVLP